MTAYEQRSYPGGATKTTLSADITASALSISVVSAAGYADGTAGPAYIIIDYDNSKAEKVRYTSLSGNSFVVPATGGRGQDGTTAQTHAAGAQVLAVWTATDAAEANKAVVNTIGKVTSKGDLLAGTAANTMDRVAAGTDGAVPIYDTTQPTGVRPGTNPTITDFTNGQHTHAAGSGGGQLAQANTHGSADTDTAATSLHHTLGTTANQAAAGNHGHTGFAATAHTHAESDVTNLAADLAGKQGAGNYAVYLAGGSQIAAGQTSAPSDGANHTIPFGVTFPTNAKVVVTCQQSGGHQGYATVVGNATTTSFDVRIQADDGGNRTYFFYWLAFG